MLTADNCVIRSSDVLESRRGFKASASCGAPVNALAFKQGVAVGITYDNPGAGITGTLRRYDPVANAWTQITMPSLTDLTTTNGLALPIDRPGGFATVDTRFVSSNKSVYFQSRYGLLKTNDSISYVNAAKPAATTGPSDAPALELTGCRVIAQNPSGAFPSTFLANGFQVAYRFTACHFGANGELIESAPSERVIASNTSGVPQQVAVFWNNQPMFPPSGFLRIYRSKQAANGSQPSDEMFLIAEVLPGTNQSSGSSPFTTNVYDGFLLSLGAAHTALYIDITSDSNLSVPLYTNAQTGGTVAVANSPPPLSVDMAWFRSRMYYLNTTQRQTVAATIIGTGTGGVSEGDYLSVNGNRLVFTANNTDFSVPPVKHINLYTAGTVTQNRENTGRRAAAAISGTFKPDGSGVMHAWYECLSFYSSASDADAGSFIVSSMLPGVDPFVFTTSTYLGWDRDYTAGLVSSSNAQVSGLSWSNPNQPEGVPLANNTLIGDPTAAGQRCIALKEALFVFKQDGLWKITDDGSEIGPTIQPVDPTIRLVAPETAVALDNFILALCDQGVVLISETGAVVNISHRQIERELLALIARVGSSALANLAFGVAYQPEHTYILSLPESSNATACTRQYIYNLQTEAWTSSTVPNVLCGAVHPDTGQLYYGRTDGTIWIERKNYDSSDYQDPGFTIASPTVSAVATMVFAGDLRSGATPFAVGDLVQQFQALHALRQRVVSVTYSSTLNQTTVKLDAVPRYAWNNAVPLTVAKAIQCNPTLLPIFADEPLQDKEWGDAFLSFRYCDLDFLVAGFTSEKYPIPSAANPAIERINNSDGSAAPITLQGWAPSPWGQTLWGRQTRDVLLRATIPQDVQGYSAQLTLSLSIPCAYSRFELSAIDVKIAGATSQVTR